MKSAGRQGCKMKTLLAVITGILLSGCGEADRPTVNAADDTQALIDATAEERRDDSPALSPPVEPETSAEVLLQELAYGEGEDSNLVGFLAMPSDVTEPLPAVLVIHEWWGLDEDIRATTERLAGEGFIVLAVDLYGGAVAESPTHAQQLMSELLSVPDKALNNIRQAYQYLDRYALAPAVGTIGWALGGGLSLQAALALGDELDAMVMYYGQVVTDAEELAGLNVPMLGLFGADDEGIQLSEVEEFRRVLDELGKRASIHIYPDVGPVFANPKGETYDADAAEDAWARTVEFLNANLN